MASTTFINGATTIMADWLNDTNAAVYNAATQITGSVPRKAIEKFSDTVSVKDFGAVGDGVTNDTAAIQAAINYASTNSKRLLVPGETYNIVPATLIDDEDTSYPTYVAFTLKSNLQIEADFGASFKVADNVSTDAAPLSMGMFGTDVPLSSISIVGLTMDMNGANNPISPLRPATYRRYNQSQILVSGKPGGQAAYIDDVLIQRCRFINNPGVCCIVMAQSNAVGSDIGQRWDILDNDFVNNGLDTDDHTSVFGWADDVVFQGNKVYNTTRFATVGRTGGNTCYEVHGNRHRITNNLFYNYVRGVWISSNLTDSEVQDTIVSNNTFYTMFYGVDFFRTSASLGKASNTVISGNTFRFDANTVAAPVPSQKVAIQIASEYQQGYVLIEGNTATSTDNVVGSVFFSVVTQAVASQAHTNITVQNNTVKGFLTLAAVEPGGVSGIGDVTIANNQYIEPLTSPTFTTGIGIYIEPTSTIKTLIIRGNDFIDDRATSKISYGVYMAPGTIDYLYYQPGGIHTTLLADYYENGTTVTKRVGYFDKVSFTPVWKTGGTNVTVGNGYILGTYTLQENQVTVMARLTIGATTVLPAGSISMQLPFASATSGLQYMGDWRIVDASAGAFYFGTSEIDGTSNELTFQLNGSTFATTGAPVALATGDTLSVQITYSK